MDYAKQQLAFTRSDRRRIELRRKNQQIRRERLRIARNIATHTKAEWDRLVEVCGSRCVRCGIAATFLVKDHIIPLYQGGHDGIDNLQPLCDPCNGAKRAEDIDHRPAGWKERM